MPHNLHLFYFNPLTWKQDIQAISSQKELELFLSDELNPELFNHLPLDLQTLRIDLDPLLYQNEQINEQLSKSFNNLFERCLNLKVLDLSFCHFYCNKDLKLPSLLQNMPPSLHQLHLQFQCLSNDEDLYQFLTTLPPTITYLDLGYNLISRTLFFQANPPPRTIFFHSHSQFAKLMRLLSPTLQFLDLTNNPISDISIEELAHVLTTEQLNPELKISLIANFTTTISELLCFVQKVPPHDQSTSYQKIMEPIIKKLAAQPQLTEKDFSEKKLLESWTGDFNRSIVAWHYQFEQEKQKGLWLQINGLVAPQQFMSSSFHPQILKFQFYTQHRSKLFWVIKRNWNWIFVPESLIQTEKAKDSRLGTRPCFEWLKLRIPRVLNQEQQAPNFTKIKLGEKPDCDWVVGPCDPKCKTAF